MVKNKSNLQDYISKRIRLLRIERGYTQEQLEEMADLGTNYVYKLENLSTNLKIQTKEKRTHYIQEEALGGPGHLITTQIIDNDEELLGKGRLFKENVLEKDCGVGYHVHEGDAEIYVIQSGEAEYNDNGTIKTVRAGDVTFTGPGEGHSLTNKKDEPVKFVALIIYE